MIARAAIVSLLVTAVGCHASAPTTPAHTTARTAAPTGAASTAAATADSSWAGASWEDRHDTMTFVVLPNMARTFQRFAGTTYPEMTCATCHGTNAEPTRYRMPAAHALAPLDPQHLPTAGPPAADTAEPPEARMVRFMTDVVTPQLADLTDDPNVSCFSCHPRSSP